MYKSSREREGKKESYIFESGGQELVVDSGEQDAGKNLGLFGRCLAECSYMS